MKSRWVVVALLAVGASACTMSEAGVAESGVAAADGMEAVQYKRDISKAEYERWRTEVSNWGRWGKADEIGTLNLITAEKRKQAATLVREGFSVSIARSSDSVKAIDNPNPFERVATGLGGDRFAVTYHGWAVTHLDSLAHHFDFDGAGYNGYVPEESVVMKNGHPKNSIHNVKDGIFTRGILIDIPRLKGVPYLEPGTPIYVEDLEAFEKMAGIRVSAGDVLLVRTGVWARREVKGPWVRGRRGASAGLHVSVIPWLKQRDIAVLGSDHPIGVNPSEFPQAAHDFALVGLGVHLIDNADLEALAVAAAQRKRWEFLLTAAPLPVRGATGSPINPVATF
jgi:kynurenine formamidase